jgi:hypothetical protein
MSDLILSKFPLSAGLALPKDSEAYQDSMASMDEIARLLSDDSSPIQAWQLVLDLDDEIVGRLLFPFTSEWEEANARNLLPFSNPNIPLDDKSYEALNSLIEFKLEAYQNQAFKFDSLDFEAVRGKNILRFSEHIGVHPAHLLPNDMAPAPRGIVEACIYIINHNSEYNKNDIETARQFLKFENAKYQIYLDQNEEIKMLVSSFMKRKNEIVDHLASRLKTPNTLGVSWNMASKTFKLVDFKDGITDQHDLMEPEELFEAIVVNHKVLKENLAVDIKIATNNLIIASRGINSFGFRLFEKFNVNKFSSNMSEFFQSHGGFKSEQIRFDLIYQELSNNLKHYGQPKSNNSAYELQSYSQKPYIGRDGMIRGLTQAICDNLSTLNKKQCAEIDLKILMSEDKLMEEFCNWYGVSSLKQTHFTKPAAPEGWLLFRNNFIMQLRLNESDFKADRKYLKDMSQSLDKPDQPSP